VAAETSSAQPSIRADPAAWIALLFGIWIVGGLVLVLWALEQGQALDVAASIYHVPLYVGLGALTLFCGVRVIRAIRHGDGWRGALPPGYGTLGVGLVGLLAALVLDLGWREGVGISFGIEGGMAPSRILVAIAVVLVAITPLRAALVL